MIISSSLSPNTDWRDVLAALQILVKPWTWKRGGDIEKVESWFRNYFQTDTAVSFNAGRAALLAILEAFGIGRGDEVLLQAFTCVAVPNSVLWAGAKPVYVDIDDTFNMDPVDAEKKITPKTKAIIVQHTFGIPAQINKLKDIAARYHLILIEDCAHSLGAIYKGKKIGTFGDAAFFSFGRDKVVSSVWGGMAIGESTLKKFQRNLPYPSYFWIFQQLLHPIAFAIILPLYTVGLGKLLLFLLQRIHLLSLPVYREEKRGRQPNTIPAKYPNALAGLLTNQLSKLDTLMHKRRQVAQYYENKTVVGATYLRYPKLVNNPQVLRERAKHSGILLGNWYHHIIDPKGVNYEDVGYIRGSCPKAEYAAAHIINLPTTIPLEKAHKVAVCWKEYYVCF